MKLDKIENEMQRTREKISDLQNRLKELGAQKTEQENLQIVSLVRSLDIPPGDLKAFLQAAAGQPAPTAGMTGAAGYYDTPEQEDGEDEE
jgi:predicted nuclease with TOPRIM domain